MSKKKSKSDQNEKGAGGSGSQWVIGNRNVAINVGGNVLDSLIELRLEQAAQGPEISDKEWKELKRELGDLLSRIKAEAPPALREDAADQVEVLTKAITAENPDVSRMALVQDWFKRNLPKLVGAVTSVILNPLVGKLVEAAGELVAEEFRRHFGDIGSVT
jgi:hypothetical protein